MDNEFYKHVLTSMENPFFIVDPDFRLLFVNRAAEQLLGRTLEECVGLPCSICGTPLCGTDDCCIRRYLRGETAAVQRRPDGRAFRVSISDLKGPGGDRHRLSQPLHRGHRAHPHPGKAGGQRGALPAGAAADRDDDVGIRSLQRRAAPVQ